MAIETTYFPSSGDSENRIVLSSEEMEILQKVYEQISKHHHFPECCSISADALANEGFSRETGWFYTDLPDDLYRNRNTNRKQNYRGHGWNMLNDKIIDLTAIQFNPYLYEQNRLPSGIIIIEKGNNLFHRYVTRTSKIAQELRL
jgi:hypothetical protein